MRIKVLGCSGGVGPGLRTTSLLVGEHLLVDAGSGVCDLGLDAMVRLTDVLVTHSHLDHVLGLAFIADNRFRSAARPLRVHAGTATRGALCRHLFNWSLWPDFSELCCGAGPVIEFCDVEPGRALVIDGVTVTPFAVPHTVPALGFALADADGCFAFSGDTNGDDAMWTALDALPGLDALMIEIAFPDEARELGDASRHFTPARLGAELTKLHHRPQLLLSHHKPGLEAAIQAQCHAALAGWRYRHLKRGDVIFSERAGCSKI
ncbi:MAG: 3',5'-cyclic-nucleotide phosphodiesterase [Gammaproteobacteria bacterium]|nr:3',5'-cyclic-nucleotide phosphodiesterase [Gammaproteobacteria bacterium]